MYQIDNVKSFTSDMRFDVVGLTCRMKSVLMTATFKVQGSRFLRSKRPKATKSEERRMFSQATPVWDIEHLALGKFGDHDRG